MFQTLLKTLYMIFFPIDNDHDVQMDSLTIAICVLAAIASLLLVAIIFTYVIQS